MESLPTTYEALVREDLKGEKIGVKSYPMPKEIPEGHALVKMAYAPINPSDWLYFIHNIYGVPEKMTPPPSVAGFEGSGIVVGVGKGMDSALVGAKVAFLLDKSVTSFWGTWAEFTMVPKMSIIPFCPETPLENIHSCFINPVTAFAMGEYFDPEKGGSVIFNAGGSSLCQMVVRYFQRRNVKTIMIVRRQAHVDQLKKEGANWVVDSSKPDYIDNLRSVIKEADPRIFFDAVGGPDAQQVLSLMPDDSTLFNYGALGGKNFSEISSIDLIFRNKSIRWVYFAKGGLIIEGAFGCLKNRLNYLQMADLMTL